MDNFENNINAFDVDYDSGDVTFTGYVYKLNRAQLSVLNWSLYAKGFIYLQKVVEYHGENCYLPTSDHWFIKCIVCFTKKEDTKEFSTFIRTEKYRSR